MRSLSASFLTLSRIEDGFLFVEVASNEFPKHIFILKIRKIRLYSVEKATFTKLEEKIQQKHIVKWKRNNVESLI